MLRAFDAPRREECTAERPRSNTPLAAMVLLNDPTFVEAARVFAERLLREGGATAEARVELAFRLAVSRRPDAEERRLLLELLGSSRERYDAEPQAAAAVRGAGQAPSPPDLDPRELAAWTAVARAILNLNETFTRN
jgi:hypothetical protein